MMKEVDSAKYELNKRALLAHFFNRLDSTTELQQCVSLYQRYVEPGHVIVE